VGSRHAAHTSTRSDFSCPHSDLPTCTKPMRLVTAEPLTPYTNIQHAKFECDCGFSSDALIADQAANAAV
jgi:hypothetical protein